MDPVGFHEHDAVDHLRLFKKPDFDILLWTSKRLASIPGIVSGWAPATPAAELARTTTAMVRRKERKPGVVAFALHQGGPRYEEISDLVRLTCPEWWAELASSAELPHVLCGILAGRIGRAMYDGDKSYAERAASFGMQLAGSGDERVDNLVHVSFFESLHQMHPDDRRLVAAHLDERTGRMLEIMTADIGDAYSIQGLDDYELRPAGRTTSVLGAGAPGSAKSRR